MNIDFQTKHVAESFALMIMGMVGIFVVMAIILGVIVLLNKITSNDKDDPSQKKK
ncbi:MAG: OadG-related small transporter subunit [Oscillospiraceae bacterium]|jgi:Na+-transporting methylmalonyl-CoA/oxaloacetate decarboxylase gamma subunit|nr:OadG-related small transporter subunit [Oscillospiraceae bacterium]